MDKRPAYAQCEHEKNTVPQIEISEETKEALLQDHRILPLYELKCRDYVQKQRYSLTSNEKLKRRWDAYTTMVMGGRVRQGVQFPRARDFHFVNYKCGYNPSHSPDLKPTHRYQMRTGPGFDDKEELPIPDDTSLRPKLKRARTQSPQTKSAIVEKKLSRK